MNKYESIVIFKPDLSEKDLETEYSKAEDFIKKHKGKIEKSEKWGKKKLTFYIEKVNEGFFFYTAFETVPESIKPLNEDFKLDTNILRALITRRG